MYAKIMLNFIMTPFYDVNVAFFHGRNVNPNTK